MRLRAIFSAKRARRRDLDDAAVVGCLAMGAVYGLDIWKRLPIGSGRIYPALSRLEARGVVVSDWADGPTPRRRLYRLAALASTGGSDTTGGGS